MRQTGDGGRKTDFSFAVFNPPSPVYLYVKDGYQKRTAQNRDGGGGAPR